MKRTLILLLVTLVVVIIGGFIVLGVMRTIKTQTSANQNKFMQGNGNITLDGFYKGDVTGLKTNWRGKSFNASDNTGFNNFEENGQAITKYPFTTSIGKGLRDTIDVFKIDYNNPKNPWWTRAVLDEVVEVEPGKYLGKIHYRLIPGLPFSMGFFRLEKQN